MWKASLSLYAPEQPRRPISIPFSELQKVHSMADASKHLYERPTLHAIKPRAKRQLANVTHCTEFVEPVKSMDRNGISAAGKTNYQVVIRPLKCYNVSMKE